MNETAVANPAIRVCDVRKTYGDVLALDGVDVTVESGEVFGLIGPNGAGKTTLVRACTGTTTVDGDVTLFDEGPSDIDPARIALLPQAFDPPQRLTARELVTYYGGLYDGSRDANTVLEDVGLADDADVWYEKLSGGQQRRTCVATALVNDPDILFLDEPTTGIDPAGRRSIHRLIERLAGSGTTVLLTSHAMDEVQRLADRVALMNDGRIVATGSPDALIGDHGGRPRLDVRVVETPTDGTVEELTSTLNGGTTGGKRDRRSDMEGPSDGTGDGIEVSTTDDGLRLVGVRPQDIGEAVGALDAVEIPYESLGWTEPTLEDVYLALTGETYTVRDRSVGVEGR